MNNSNGNEEPVFLFLQWGGNGVSQKELQTREKNEEMRHSGRCRQFLV